MKNKQILLTSRPAGMPTLDNFSIVDAEVPEPKDGEVLLRTRFLSTPLMEQPVWNFEQEPGEGGDETDINLRAYFDLVPDEKMQQYGSDWTDEQTIEWDDNFREDGNLMLLCCERDVDVREYREVLENCINYRNRFRAIVTKPAGGNGCN